MSEPTPPKRRLHLTLDMGADDLREAANALLKPYRASEDADAEPDDDGQCSFRHPDGRRCRWEVGHVVDYHLAEETSRAGGDERDEWPEPDCRHHKHSPAFGRTYQCAKCGRYTFPLEPSEGDEPDCHTCNDTGAFRLGGHEYVCKDCPTAPRAYALVGQPSPSPDAEGGRPREADPQGPSNGNDASVDGGGDDGRSRAIFDDEGRFHGHRGGECGEHRTVGHHRAWCFDCHEWCYPVRPCASCERPMPEARVRELEAALEPFAHAAPHFTPEFDDSYELTHGWKRVTVGHLRRARAALEGGQ